MVYKSILTAFYFVSDSFFESADKKCISIASYETILHWHYFKYHSYHVRCMIRSSLLVAFTNVQHSKAQIAIYDYLLPRGDNLYIGSSNLPTFICLPCSNIIMIKQQFVTFVKHQHCSINNSLYTWL